jgi:RNA polymerase sigma-70 factor (ECF subfamily)
MSPQSSPLPLCDVLLAATTSGDLGQATTELETVLRAALATAHSAWPDVRVADGEMLRAVAARLPQGAAPGAAVAAMHISDLYLAYACAQADKRALAAFETHFLSAVASFVAQIDRSESFADDVRQILREKLLVRVAGAPPKIAEYTGRGPLGGWLRVAAVRTALNLRRSNKTRGDSDDSATEIASPTPDPEIDYLKTRSGNALRGALQATLASLPADERNVLRMHYIDGLTIDEIGTAYRVHRSTVARWLASAREKILDETKKALEGELHMARGEVESMIGLVQSQLDVSIYRYLGKAGS